MFEVSNPPDATRGRQVRAARARARAGTGECHGAEGTQPAVGSGHGTGTVPRFSPRRDVK